MTPVTPRTAEGRRFVDRHGTGKQNEIVAIEDAAARAQLEALRAEIVERIGGECVAPADPDDIICQTHSEMMFGDGHCEDWTPDLALIDALISGAAIAGVRESGATLPSYVEVHTTACHAGSDGDCSWSECPQTRDGEPTATGRHCPLDAVEAKPWVRHEAHYGNHDGYTCGFSGPHCWTCNEPWPCRASRGESGAALVSGDPEVRDAKTIWDEGHAFGFRDGVRHAQRAGAAPVGSAPYPPEPSTDGTDHAHDPEQCAACRRQADLFFASGANTERVALRLRADAIPAEIGGDSVRAFLDAEIDNRAPVGPALPPVGPIDVDRLATAINECCVLHGPSGSAYDSLTQCAPAIAAAYDRGARAALSAPAA